MQDETSPSARGARAEAAVTAALVRAGHSVFVPAFSAHSTLDVVHLDGVQLVGVQCKHATVVGTALRFWTCSNTGNIARRYGPEVAMFGVYAESTGLVYLVPAAVAPGRACFLRIDPPRNGQRAGIRWARDFELGRP